MKPGDKVILAAEKDLPSPEVGTIKDHVAASMTPPNDGFVLVSWSRTTIYWVPVDELELA